MCKRIGTSHYNPQTERLHREPFFRDTEPEEDEEDVCPVCGFDPCRCSEVDAVADDMKKRGLEVEGNK